MDEEQTNIEESINSFLEGFFSWNYPRKRILFDNLTNIYILISFLYRNMNKLEIEMPDFRNGEKASLMERKRLIDEFYKSIGINFKLDALIKNKAFNIIKTNKPEEATFYELTYGNNKYKEGRKTINVYNNGLITDSIFWVLKYHIIEINQI